MEERLQKVLSAAGLASRREAEQWIAAGRVTVDGRRAGLGDKADPHVNDIRVDGRPVKLPERKVYVLLNKPPGYTTTRRDPHARHTVMELVRDVGTTVYPVGRLDVQTAGLLLLTNDGDLAYKLSHPRFQVPRTYLARVVGSVDQKTVAAFRHGIELEDGMTLPAELRVLELRPPGREGGTGSSLVEVTLREGRKRQVRRMLKAVGHPVQELTRVALGPLRLGGLKPGQWRHLTRAELAALTKAVATAPYRPSSRAQAAAPQKPTAKQAPPGPTNSREGRRPQPGATGRQTSPQKHGSGKLPPRGGPR